jgi:hypothetical protein
MLLSMTVNWMNEKGLEIVVVGVSFRLKSETRR